MASKPAASESLPGKQEDSTAPIADTLANWKPSKQEKTVLLTLLMGSFMVSLDSFVIITSLSTIVDALGASSTQGFWIGTAFLMAQSVTMLFTVSLSDVFGRQYLMFASVAMFTAGTIVCARSDDIVQMLAGRTVQGVGAGGVTILNLVVLTDFIPLRFRPQYIGLVQVSWALGSLIGPIIGGAFATPSLWRWNFYFILPFCGATLVAVPLLVRIRPQQEATLLERVSRIDLVGAFVFISSTTSFLIAVSWGGSQQPWSSWRTIVPLLLGVIGLIISLIWEQFGAREPFLKASLFHCLSAYVVYLMIFLHGFLLQAQLYYIPFFFISVKLFSPLRTGVALLPVFALAIPTSVIVGIVNTRIGHFRWGTPPGYLLSALSTGLNILFDDESSTALWVITLLISGLGHGLLLNSLSTATQAIALRGDDGSAGAMYMFIRYFGMAIGVGVGGTIFQNVMRNELTSLGLPGQIAFDSEAYVVQLHEMGDTPERRAIISTYVQGFRGINGFLCGLSGLGFFISFLVRHFNMNKELVTDQTLMRSESASIDTETGKTNLK